VIVINYNYRDKGIGGAFETLERAQRRNGFREFDGALSRGTRNDIDVSQLIIDSNTCLQVTDDDVEGDITEGMVGKFWFLTDYSRTDLGSAGDIIRP
jgi:hypothetical protein